MIGLMHGVKIHLCTAPTDMRRGFDGLSGMVQTLLEQDPLSGHLFVFRNRNRDKLKILYCCLLYTSPSPRDQRGSRMPSSA